MKISCDIIKDILPLYAEDMVSKATKEMVDEHLCECEGCKKALEDLRKPAKLPAEVATDALKRVGDSIRRRRYMAISAAVMTVVTLFASAWLFLTVPCMLTYEEAIESVEVRQDGSVALDIIRGANGHAGFGMDGENLGHLWHTTRYDWLRGKVMDKEIASLTEAELESYIMETLDVEEITQKERDRFNNVYFLYGAWKDANGELVPSVTGAGIEGAGTSVWRNPDENNWYLNIHTGEAETLLWDAGIPAPNKAMADNTYVFAITVVLGLILAIVFWMTGKKRNDLQGEMLVRLAIVCVSTVISTLLVTGGDLIVLRDMLFMYFCWPRYIAVETVFVTLTLLFWHHLHRLNAQDKGL